MLGMAAEEDGCNEKSWLGKVALPCHAEVLVTALAGRDSMRCMLSDCDCPELLPYFASAAWLVGSHGSPHACVACRPRGDLVNLN